VSETTVTNVAGVKFP